MKKIDIACIIDDDPIFIFGTKRLMGLTHFCNSFLIFLNGEEAIDCLKPIIENGDPPEITLPDLNMPVMNGWHFLDEFIQIPTHTQILIYIVTQKTNNRFLNLD